MRQRYLFVTLALVASLALPAYGQFKDQGLGGGIGFGGTFGQTELTDAQSRFMARGFLRYSLLSFLQGELGVGFGKVGSDQYSTEVLPIDYRFLVSPFSFQSWNPYIYAGGGVLYHNIETFPANPTSGVKEDGWTGIIPAGVGMQFLIDDNTAFEVSGGYNYTFADNLNAVEVGAKDAYWNFLLGLTVMGESGSADPDGDGLTNNQEEELGTNKKIADSDGDGLSDGDEFMKYKTDPLKADSDGDGLKDGEEVTTYRTNPNKADSDGDGLNDGDEVMKHKTDPLKADTDGDGLNDGDEVTKYKTNPLMADTDNDGLNDGEEVMKHKTDPVKADTDGGSVNDGKEVANKTNPLDPTDDVPKKKEIKAEVGKAIVLEGIVFKTGSTTIEPESEDILEQAFNTLDQNKDIRVEIRGYTDNVGSQSANLRLSQRRADAVKSWLVKQGIAATRITAKGYGMADPVADNSTAEGRQKNRRIEFFRTK